MAAHDKHHYIPDAFLSLWERPPAPTKLTYFALRNGEVRTKRRAAKFAAKELGLYAVQLVAPEYRNMLEVDLFQRIDADGALAHKALLAKPSDHLPEQQSNDWIRFVASLLLRTPRFLRLWKAHADNALTQFADADETGDGLRERFYRFRERVGDRLPNDMTLHTIAELVEESTAHHALAGATWALRDVSKAKDDLLLGDEPVLRGGPLTASYFFALPISPTLLFFASNSDAAWARLAAMPDDQLVFLANRDSLTQADEYVYATGAQHSKLARRLLGRAATEGHSRLAEALGLRVEVD